MHATSHHPIFPVSGALAGILPLCSHLVMWVVFHVCSRDEETEAQML